MSKVTTEQIDRVIRALKKHYDPGISFDTVRVSPNEVFPVLEAVQNALLQRDALLAENEQLRAEVREWICESCNTVYPGPPQKGFSCVICPKCGGITSPRMTAENASLKAEVEVLRILEYYGHFKSAAPQAEVTKSDDRIFIEHIREHLLPGQDVICKICGKTAHEIIRAGKGKAVLSAPAPVRVSRENFPKVVCLCGSTRFLDAFRKAMAEETYFGRIVLSIGCNLRDHEFDTFTQEHKAEIKIALDELHKRKIDLADEVLVLNVGGYVGDSTKSEIRYAIEHGKPIRWLEPDKKWEPEKE